MTTIRYNATDKDLRRLYELTKIAFQGIGFEAWLKEAKIAFHSYVIDLKGDKDFNKWITGQIEVLENL